MSARAKEGKPQLENPVEVYRNSFVSCNDLGLATFLPHLHFLSNNFHALGFVLSVVLSEADWEHAEKGIFPHTLSPPAFHHDIYSGIPPQLIGELDQCHKTHPQQISNSP